MSKQSYATPSDTCPEGWSASGLDELGLRSKSPDGGCAIDGKVQVHGQGRDALTDGPKTLRGLSMSGTDPSRDTVLLA